ncbi:HET-domain-containing protein [Pyrenochaeta sp. DS3sAY3a]|nr:HET-domain-containing protein [Pyrenochaeta sp. DS3sAY3a]
MPDSKTHFRLLEILRAEPHGQVVCELTPWPMDSAPSYYAISYTWGDPKLCTHIMINGAPLFVRQNCEDVLRQAAFSRASKYVWVDALCIDQDSTEEKSDQVAIMGQIYRNSAHVFACLGLHADDSEYLFQTIETWQSLLSSIHSHVRISSSSSEGQWSISNPIPVYRWLALRCFFAMKASLRRRLLLAFGAFVKRPYFSRVWVLQELYLAPTISFFCGMDFLSVDNVLSISLLIDFWFGETVYASNWSNFTRKIVSFLSVRPLLFTRQKVCRKVDIKWPSIQPQLGCLALASGAHGLRRLAEVIEVMRHFQCFDVMDRLYGILSLVDWRGKEAPPPDYQKDGFGVAVEILSRYMTDRVCAPMYGRELDWIDELCEVFVVTGKHFLLSKAILARCPEGGMTSTILNVNHNNPILFNGRKRHLRPKDRTNCGKFKPFSAFKTHWRGVPLHSSDAIITASSTPTTTILCCAPPNELTDLVHVVDQGGEPVAYAAAVTQVGDWLLISDEEDYEIRRPIVLIARHHPDGKYVIIGKGYLYNEHVGMGYTFHFDPKDWKILGRLLYTDFDAHWHPEDLFLMEWAWIHHTQSLFPQKRENLEDWLELRICGTEGSSYFERTSPIEASETPFVTPIYRDPFQLARSMGIELTNETTPLLQV